MRILTALRLVVLIVVACGPAAGTAGTASPTATPSSTATESATPSATPTASPTPATSATPIALPTSAFIAAAGNGVVWALVANSRLFRSADRGDTWFERTVPSNVPVNSIAFVNDREGWILAASSAGAQCQVQSVVIYRTSDGAATWQRIDPQGIADSGCKESLAFNDATHGYLSAWDQNSAPRVFRTTDGGTTWNGAAPLADPPGFTTGVGVALRAAGVADFVSVTLVTTLGIQGGREVDYIYRSSDRGTSWAYVTAAPLAGLAPVMITPQRWLQISPPATAQETTNGGVSWHPFVTDYSQAAPVAPQIVFGDAVTGYATARGSIQRTTDGGAHWTSLRTPGT
ncbi:MAG: hypothetical protein M3R54_00990 [Chloroflexota bacterium]|nr:hypothetical protein [Chloroflexota bacterium]